MLENLHFAFRGIWSHKMRSFLTMLGVIIGIASIIAIVSTITGTNRQIMQNLVGAGNNNVTISLQQGGSDYYMDNGAPSGVTVASDDQREEIRSLDGVEDASFYQSRSYGMDITNGALSLDGAAVYGVDDHYMSTVGLVVYRGRSFVKQDYSSPDKVVLLDENAAETLFTDGDPVGGTIEISGEPFTVIGLYRKSSTFQPTINSISDYQTYYQQEYGTVLMPDTDWPIVYAYDEPVNCVVRAKSVKDMSAVGKNAAEIMNECISSDQSDLSYNAEDLVEKAKSQQELASSTNNLLIWVASIALLVGGIGRDRLEEGTRCAEEEYSCAVPHRVSAPHEHWRCPRRGRRHHHGLCHLENDGHAGGDQCSVDLPRRRLLDGHRHRVRPSAVDQGGESEPDRCAEERVKSCGRISATVCMA